MTTTASRDAAMMAIDKSDKEDDNDIKDDKDNDKPWGIVKTPTAEWKLVP